MSAPPDAPTSIDPTAEAATDATVAIETATETVAVAVRAPNGLQAEFALTCRRRHVETLTPALEHLLAQLDLTPPDLGVVAVDIGPGLFTGLRVGVAAAKGLAQSLDIGVVCATSLEVLVAGAAAAGHRGHVLACVDARRGEVFASVWAPNAVDELSSPGDVVGRDDGGEPLAAGLFAPAELADALTALDGIEILAVGDGAIRYADTLATVSGVQVVTSALSFPPPIALLDIAATRLAAGESPVAPGSVVPLYMREADAVSNFERVARS